MTNLARETFLFSVVHNCGTDQRSKADSEGIMCEPESLLHPEAGGLLWRIPSAIDPLPEGQISSLCVCVCVCRKQPAQCKDGEGQEGRKEILLEKCPQRQKPKNPLQCKKPPAGLFTLTETAALSISHRPDETITKANLTFL